MTRRSMVSVGIGLVASWLGMAPAAAEDFTLDQIYRLAYERNEAVKIAREQLRVAEGDKDRARSAVLPLVTLKGNYDRMPEKTGQLGSGGTTVLQPETAYGLELDLSQPLYSGGKNLY